MKYDYLLVGTGLFSAAFAALARDAGRRCLAVEKRPHIGGNVYCEECDGILVHKYGAHIFHTDSDACWDFVNRFATFNHFINSPLASVGGKLYNLPFNMNTFHQIWHDVVTPEQARQRIAEQSAEMTDREPANLEEQAIRLVGREIYELLIRGYTEKQWGCPCSELPPDIIKRLPLRFTYDNNYFNDRYQGIPLGGYTGMIGRMFEGTDIRLNCDYLQNRAELDELAETVIYTGTIDGFYDYCYGELQYRSLRFETEIFPCRNVQSVAVMNYPEAEIPYTRTIEHKYFEPENPAAFNAEHTCVTREYPADWHRGAEPYYPVNSFFNISLYNKYRELAKQEKRVIFGGRLGSYRYLDMDDTILEAMALFQRLKT